jgi:dihydropteroate synthase
MALRVPRPESNLMNPTFRARRDAFFGIVGTRPVVMGILNVTPDSFSDGGQFFSAAAAIAHAHKLVANGCDILDVGGESTRPGATPVPAAEELARIEPVLAELGSCLTVPLSIDTYKATVAARATQLGAVIVNDVWGLQRDPAMADAVAQAEAGLVIMHNREEKNEAVDIVADMQRFFDHSLELAARAGIPSTRIILDPGIGFGKTSRQNVEALARVAELGDYGLPIMVGVSRKRFYGSLLDIEDATRVSTSIAANLAAAANGACIFRVHDVAENVAALRLFDLIRRSSARSLA